MTCFQQRICTGFRWDFHSSTGSLWEDIHWISLIRFRFRQWGSLITFIILSRCEDCKKMLNIASPRNSLFIGHGISLFCFHVLRAISRRRKSTSGERVSPTRGTGGSVGQRKVGHCLWWRLGCPGCKSGLSSARIQHVSLTSFQHHLVAFHCDFVFLLCLYVLA